MTTEQVKTYCKSITLENDDLNFELENAYQTISFIKNCRRQEIENKRVLELTEKINNLTDEEIDKLVKTISLENHKIFDNELSEIISKHNNYDDLYAELTKNLFVINQNEKFIWMEKTINGERFEKEFIALDLNYLLGIE